MRTDQDLCKSHVNGRGKRTPAHTSRAGSEAKAAQEYDRQNGPPPR